jgi:arylsulfatase A-like enzyme
MTRVALIAALLVLVPAAAAGAAPAESRPNLLVIMTDDQRADGTLTMMPETLRRIGRQGTTFVRAHTTTPKCCPSRASFFTGLYPHNHGVVGNTHADALDHRRTVQRLVKRSGYRTGIFGKFLNGWPVEQDPPFFDEWATTNGGYDSAYWNLDGRIGRRYAYTTDLISDRAVRFVRRAERRDTQPWLAWVTPYAPHLPSTPPRRDRAAPLAPFAATAAMTESDWSDKPDFLDRARGYQQAIDTMREDGRRSLIAVDDMVARLMDELRARREYDNTLVVFTSDNGFLLGEHGGLAHKDLPYLPATQIPLLVRWPGQVAPGRESRRPVTNVDVATTLLEAAGVEPDTDGRSLFETERRGELFMEHHGGYNGEPDALPLPPWRSILARRYRYTEYYENGSVIAREYYDHGIDPWELENRAPELTLERIAVLSARLDDYARCRGRACP